MRCLLLRALLAARPGFQCGGRHGAFLCAKRGFSAERPVDRGNGTLETHLSGLANAQARQIVAQIAQKNQHLRTSKPAVLTEALELAKAEHPNCVIVTRCGEYYEVHGTDVALCIEYCGLQPTGVTPHLEIPPDRLPHAIEALRRRGIGMAIYDYVTALESEHEDDERLVLRKSLVFSHEAQPTDGHVTHDRQSTDSNFTGSALGVAHNRSGYSVSVIDPVKRTVEVRDRLTFASALSLLQTDDCRVVIFQNGNTHVKKLLSQVSTAIHYEPLQGHNSTKAFHDAACRSIKMRLEMRGSFRVINTATSHMERIPLDLETASVLGLGDGGGTGTGNTNGLHLQMLPGNAPVYMKRYMRFMLAQPPPAEVAEDVRYVIGKLAQMQVPLVDARPVSPFKVRSLISQQRVDVTTLRDIEEALKGFTYYAKTLAPGISKRVNAIAIVDLKLNYKLAELLSDAERCLQIIDSAMSFPHEIDHVEPTGMDAIDSLFRRSESCMKSVKQHLLLRDRKQVDEAAFQLLKAIAEEYMTVPQFEDPNGNSVANRGSLTACIRKHLESKADSIPNLVVNDHFVLLNAITDTPDHTILQTTETVVGNKRVRGYTSRRVTDELRNYRNKCAIAEANANQTLRHIVRSLAPHTQSIVICSHFLVVVQTLAGHAGMAVPKGWTVPSSPSTGELLLKKFTPAFLPHDDVIPLSLKLNGTHVLLGPNNSGRSTLIASVLGACICAQSGLYLPCASGSKVPKFTNIVYNSPLRYSGTGDVSPFEYNINAIEHVIAKADNRSLVLIDDLGAHLDALQATAFVAVVVQRLAQTGCTSIIATNVGSDFRGHVSNAHFSSIVTSNGNMLLSEARCLATPLKHAFENSAFLGQIQQEMDRYVNQSSSEIPAVNSHRYGRPNIDTSAVSQKKRACFEDLIREMPSALRDAADILCAAFEELSTSSIRSAVVHIAAGCMPPPILSNVPVTYAIIVPLTPTGKSHETELDTHADACFAEGEFSAAVYVGETGNLDVRLKAHRSKPLSTVDEYMGKTYMNHEPEMTAYLQAKSGLSPEKSSQLLNWQASHVLAAKMNTRSDAKVTERKLIKRLYNHQNKLVLLSQRDGVYREMSAVD
ncbi:DNA mismatch repair protein, putative [Babesia bigemina]|uniref:DNA mismatch repair protein, putative n=1 Tax=Babesia bigemina TaxID=5866 RepID=A0A061D361_BABBI|nr:DNA mismatch repair protein, putative [Babesia bigemina]CDR94532.1 DNA mismatch repair protein, putative [Babesia bigemina]|eukprot:XP_012766718.1 DNA mismatch repair protein, putative [Babesia bigemina]